MPVRGLGCACLVKRVASSRVGNVKTNLGCVTSRGSPAGLLRFASVPFFFAEIGLVGDVLMNCVQVSKVRRRSEVWRCLGAFSAFGKGLRRLSSLGQVPDGKEFADL